MALPIVTVQPDETVQTGKPTNTVIGAVTMHAALGDSSDASYVQLTARARNDNEVIRVGFPTPTVPAGAKVVGVTLRRRVQTVVVVNPITQPPPVCHHWFRFPWGVIEILGQAQERRKISFNNQCPTSQTTSQWTEETVATIPNAGGQEWTIVDPVTGGPGNLADFQYDIGRGDDGLLSYRVSAVYLDVQYQQASTMTATGPTTGADGTATRPTVRWLWSSPDSKPQQAFRTAIYTAAQVAQPGFSAFITTPTQASNWTPGTTWSATGGWMLGEDLQWTLTGDLTDGQYHAYVQGTAQWDGAGDFTTPVSSISWVRAATPVSPPANAVLDSVVHQEANHRIAVTMHPGGASPATNVFTVERSDNGADGPWVAIPSMSYIPADGMNPVTVYDRTALLNIVSMYRVIAYTGDPRKAAVAPSNVKTVTRAGDEHLLIHATNPLLDTWFQIKAPKANEGIKRTQRRTTGTFLRLGGPGKTVLPIVVNGPWHGDRWELTAQFMRGEPSFDTHTRVEGLERDGATVLWLWPTGDWQWVVIGPGDGGKDTEETLDALPGNPRKIQWRRRALTLMQVDPPPYY